MQGKIIDLSLAQIILASFFILGAMMAFLPSDAINQANDVNED